jgi:hypothetical protein
LFLIFIIPYFFYLFCSLFFFLQHADVHATACWRIGSYAPAKNMDKRTKLRTLCETRWTSQADALYTFKTSFPIVVHALERLQGLGDDKAGQYLASITRFVFVIALICFALYLFFFSTPMCTQLRVGV